MASLSSVADRCHRHYVTEWSDDGAFGHAVGDLLALANMLGLLLSLLPGFILSGRRGNAWDSERGVRSSLRQYPEHDRPLMPHCA